MRDYSKVSSGFWTGKTGRSLRGDMQTQIVAMYLMTSPHSNMIGVFHCPILYIAHETGSPLEGAREGLNKLIEGGFCTYEEDSETIWVHQMASFQIGEALKPNDNRVKDIRKQYENLPESRIKTEFFKKYAEAFHLEIDKPLISPSKAPPKPEAGAGAGTGAGTESKGLPLPVGNEAPKKINPTIADVRKALRSEGLGALGSPPTLQVLLDAGATVETFVDAYRKVQATPEKATFPYVMAIVESQMEAAARLASKSLLPTGNQRQPAPVDY